MSNNFNSRFPSINGHVLRALREYFNITGEILAKALGFASKSTISKLETSTKIVKSDIVNALYEHAHQNNLIYEEDEFTNLIINFKKNYKLENSLNQNSAPQKQIFEKEINTPKACTNSEETFKEKVYRQTYSENKELESQIKAADIKVFEFVRSLDDVKFEVRRQHDKYDGQIESLKDTIASFKSELAKFNTVIDNLRAELGNHKKEFAEFMEDTEETFQDVEKAMNENGNSNGLSGLMNSPIMSNILPQIVQALSTAVIPKINDLLSKNKGTNEVPNGIPVNFANFKPGFSASMDPTSIGMDDLIPPDQF